MRAPHRPQAGFSVPVGSSGKRVKLPNRAPSNWEEVKARFPSAEGSLGVLLQEAVAVHVHTACVWVRGMHY